MNEVGEGTEPETATTTLMTPLTVQEATVTFSFSDTRS